MNSDSNRERVAETARFDDSFATHMIRDFFLVLVAVVIIELSVRFALVLYEFHHNQDLTTQIAAERLAALVPRPRSHHIRLYKDPPK